MTCPNCGKDPCATPGFCATCRATEEKRAAEKKATQPKADDWLAAFAKKSDEALAAKVAAKQISPPPKAQEVIAQLASKPSTEYDQLRGDVAEALGIRRGTLDERVQAARVELEVEREGTLLPHWKVDRWPEPVDGAELLNSIRQVFRHYIVLPKYADVALSLWVLHAWTMNAGDISPFMVLTSPTKRCGKTSVLILLYFLTPKSELASNITAAALFRYIEAARPTLLIDEADSFVKDNEELRGILNSGHTRVAAYIIRNVEVNGEHTPRRFSTWAAKAIATIKKLADTLEDRSITITLQRKARRAKVERLRRRDNEQFSTLRRKAARWAEDNFDKLVDPDPPVPEELNDRAADNWRPLLAIADLVGGVWPEEARQAALVLSGESQDGAIGVELLKDIRLAFGEDDAIRSKDLVAKLAEDKDRPWADWSHGRELTQKQLGGLLSPFGIRSETVSVPGFNDAKGYKRAHFEELWAVYCPGQNPSAADSALSKCRSVGMPVESAQVGDFQSVGEASADASENGKLSYSHAGSDASTLQNGQVGGEHGFDQGAATSTPARTPDDGNGQRPSPPEVCDHCRQPADDQPLRTVSDGTRLARLHRCCEVPWFELGSRRDGSSLDDLRAVRGGEP
jgi:putative DNA primase/helicase